MDGITWKQARIAGLTKKQFDALDTFNYGAKDQKIDASLWQQVTSILEEAKENHSIKKTNGIRSELAKMLSIEQVAEKESETTYGFSWGGKKGNFFTKSGSYPYFCKMKAAGIDLPPFSSFCSPLPFSVVKQRQKFFQKRSLANGTIDALDFSAVFEDHKTGY